MVPAVWHMVEKLGSHVGKQGRLATKTTKAAQSTWPEAPPGLTKFKPLKRNKVQQEANDLLAPTWTIIPEDIQGKLQALSIGPAKPDEPELTDLLKTHMAVLPQQVQDAVTKLTTPEPITEREIAAKLKSQVTDLKNLSIRNTQLQTKIDNVKAQYASQVQDTQDLQVKLTDGQKALKALSEDYVKAVNQSPAPVDLTEPTGQPEQIPTLNLLRIDWASPLLRSKRPNFMGCLGGPIRTLMIQQSAGKLRLRH